MTRYCLIATAIGLSALNLLLPPRGATCESLKEAKRALHTNSAIAACGG
jgi:hypothetical protein